MNYELYFINYNFTPQQQPSPQQTTELIQDIATYENTTTNTTTTSPIIATNTGPNVTMGGSESAKKTCFPKKKDKITAIHLLQ